MFLKQDNNNNSVIFPFDFYAPDAVTCLVLEMRERGWQALKGSLKGALKELSQATEKASQWLWLRRSQTTWGHLN